VEADYDDQLGIAPNVARKEVAAGKEGGKQSIVRADLCRYFGEQPYRENCCGCVFLNVVFVEIYIMLLFDLPELQSTPTLAHWIVTSDSGMSSGLSVPQI
jgi:hypothetical protein